MSRYHPVRPKQQKHKHQAAQAAKVPQPAAPAQRENWKVTQAQIEETAIQLYKARGGDQIDAAIARWKRTLELYDRELEVVAAGDGSKAHRWTISPSIAFRCDKYLQQQIEQQARLKDECLHEAVQLIEQVLHQASRMQAPDDSLCPPKSPDPAPAAASTPQPGNTGERKQAEPAPIAA